MAMAEPLDAPMTDSGDIDVSMFSGGMATADSWLSAEASMGDVAFSSETATFDYVQEDIEIEMLDDDEPITEYDMADDGDTYHELQDVEVHDASRAATPPMVESRELADDAPPEDVEFMHIPSSDGDIHTSLYPQHPPEVDASPSVTQPHIVSTASPDHSSLPLQSESLERQQEVAVSADSTGTEVQSSTAHPPEQAQRSPTLHAADSADTHRVERPADEVEIVVHPDADNASSREIVESTTDQAEAGRHVNIDDHCGTNDTQADADEGTDGLATEGGDPHEISEGVYIDPPPAVLVTLPPTAELTECCLFNHPAVPSPPLSSVFDALRHQDCVLNIPGSAEAEFILDAYELQLAISEDNVYAHEVTLHELNVIHDGSDLQGPLRLKLKMNSPRFVTRYHHLRDQISRLNLSEGDEYHLEVVVEHTSYDGTAQEADAGVQHPLDDNVASEAAHEDIEEVQEDLEPGIPGSQHQEPRDKGEVQQPEDSVGEPYQFNDDDDESAGVHGDPEEAEAYASNAVEEHVVEGDHLDDGAVSGAGDEEDHLDADDIHAQVDEGEGGDYFEHEQFPDDEDEFGEDLPEELGGQVADVSYTHPGVAEDDSEDLAANVQAAAIPSVSSEDVLEKLSAHSSTSGVDDEELPDNDRLLHNHGLNPHGSTDLFPEANSNNDETEDQYQRAETTSSGLLGATARPPSDLDDTLDVHEQATQESNTLPSDDEDGLLDDWDEHNVKAGKNTPDQLSTQEDAISRKSSTATLASKTSKRTYDEVELEDFDDSPSLPEAASSPDNKRLRTQ
ncbi:hypothetical protein GY45DRAFT_1332969 [Cubamyces sp. BRFM 1775]|nr:hypothetical protein GY45DRAFT_1332969 [Cubamyces sp. BRFM 1775]